MYATIMPRRLLCIAALFGAMTFPPPLWSCAKEPVASNEDGAKELGRLVDSLASRNRAPKIVHLTFNDQVPIIDNKFDARENERVGEVFYEIVAIKTDAMWWQLAKREGDEQYAITAYNDEFVDMTAENFSVGSLCRHVASEELGAPYLRHMMTDELLITGTRFAPQEVFWRNKDRWAGKPLYLIQIAACEEAIKQMSAATGIDRAYGGEIPGRSLTADEKAAFATEVRKEIETLKSTKAAITATRIRLPGTGMKPLREKDVQKARELREQDGQLKRRAHLG